MDGDEYKIFICLLARQIQIQAKQASELRMFGFLVVLDVVCKLDGEKNNYYLPFHFVMFCIIKKSQLKWKGKNIEQE